jgi:uncharacterized protein YndB with AHSA1/START domain
MRLHVEVTIAAPPEAVWAHLEDISTHVEWMTDAVAIEFLGGQERGVGTRFTCRTRVLFLRTADVMEITEWEPPHLMGVRHTGAVSGEGRFELRPADPAGQCTTMLWVERLLLPWWLGGRLGATLAAPVLHRLWRTNLERLAGRVEPGTGTEGQPG